MSDTKKSPLNVTNEMNRMGLNKNNAVSNKDWESSMQQMQGTSGDVGYKPSSIPEDYAENVTADYTDEDYKRMEKEKRQQENANKVTFTEQKGKEAQEVSKGLREFINGILHPQKEQSLSASRIKEKRNKKTRADYDNFIREMIDNKNTFIEKFGYDKTTPPEIVFKMMMKQAGDNNTKAIEEIAKDIKEANVAHDTQMAAKGKADSGDGNSQGAVNNQQASATPTPSTPPPAPTTPQKKSDTEDLTKGGLGDGIPEVGSFYTPDVREELKAIDKSMEKEQQTGHKFYSRIFSVPEWFPKGLDEFREKKRELTDKPVYDKKSGKYERNTTGKMATAKAEQEMAEEVIDGLQRDVNNARDKGFISDPILNKRSKEQYEKSVSVLNDINKQIDDIDKEYNDLSAIEEYKGTDFDRLAKEQDRKERLSVLRQQREEAKNKLSEQEDIVNKFKTQYETRGDATSNLIESQQETIDAIKNGDLKDANEAVDNLKEEYRAAKRKLIKENAGNIARNVWFIIDLVTTMNRNAARLMPQGKYSPNLGNFETPALFQDYAEQLKNIRDSYNEANKEAAVGKVRLDLERGSEANKAIGEYYKNLADKDKDIFDLSVQTEKDRRAALIRIMENKETGRFDNELKKDYIKFYMDTHKNTQASLQEMLNDIDAVNTFIRRPKILAGLDPNQQSNYWYYEQATSPNTKDAIFKEMVTDIYRRGKQENKSDDEIRNDLRSFLMDLIRNEVVTTNDAVKLKDYQTKLGYVDSTANTVQGVYDTLIGKPLETATNVVNAATNVVKAIP